MLNVGPQAEICNALHSSKTASANCKSNTPKIKRESVVLAEVYIHASRGLYHDVYCTIKETFSTHNIMCVINCIIKPNFQLTQNHEKLGPVYSSFCDSCDCSTAEYKARESWKSQYKIYGRLHR